MDLEPPPSDPKTPERAPPDDDDNDGNYGDADGDGVDEDGDGVAAVRAGTPGTLEGDAKLIKMLGGFWATPEAAGGGGRRRRRWGIPGVALHAFGALRLGGIGR